MSELFVRYGQIDPEAKPDSTPKTTDIQSWAQISDLKKEGIEVGNYATCEHNQAILDGTQQHFPDNPYLQSWGWWSNSMSDNNGIFDNPPTLEVTFTSNHKSPGLTLWFYPHSDDYAKEVRVTWFASDLTTVLHTETFTLNNNIGIIEKGVINWRKIKVEMLSTNIRNRYIKMYRIDYGVIIPIRDHEIDKANILEEIDPISDILSINTFNLTRRSHEANFSPISGGDTAGMLMRKQWMEAYVDNSLFGKFYLQDWKDINNSGLLFDFNLIDTIGILDNYQFMGGKYVNMPIKTLILNIFKIPFPVYTENYFMLEESIADATVTGYIPVCTCREALQQICFALGVIADTSRRDYVYIYPLAKTFKSEIPLYEIYRGGSNQMTPYFSGVDVIVKEYVQSNTSREVFNGTLMQGSHTLIFSEPLHTLSISGATITTAHINYAVINVITSGTVILSGLQYTANTITVSLRDEIAAGEIEQIATFEKCTLLNKTIAEKLARDIFDYLHYRIQINNPIRLESHNVGDIIKMETYGLPVTGILEQLDINLRAGKAQSRLIGNVGE